MARPTDSYVVTIDKISNLILFDLIAFILSGYAGWVIYPIIARKIKSTANKKPKAYYQFWAGHVIMLTLLIYTLQSAYFSLYTKIVFGISAVLSICMYWYIFTEKKFNTPTQCCVCHWICKKSSSIIMALVSLYITTIFIYLCIIALPTVIFIYYLYPTHTLIRLPFIINSILYINSVLALLLFQCETLCFVYTKYFTKKLKCKNRYCIKNEDEKFYEEYYNEAITGSKFKRSGSLVSYLVQPIVTITVIYILVEFIRVLSDLFRLQSHFTVRNQVDTLILLVLTLLLLVGSWWKLDGFFDIEEPRSKKKLLHEILEEMKRQRRTEIETLTDLETQLADTEMDTPPINQSDVETQLADTEMETPTNQLDEETQPADTEMETPLTNPFDAETQPTGDII